MRKDLVPKSISLSYLLRHGAKKEGVDMDDNGWVSSMTAMKWLGVLEADLQIIVDENPKKRFEFSDDGLKIRAQGHSLDIDLQLAEQVPPDVLYHGTSADALRSIMDSSISKMDRQHVHLSVSYELASSVGSRHGRPTVIQVDTKSMLEDGFKFYLSNNGVWLTDDIPARYLTKAVK